MAVTENALGCEALACAVNDVGQTVRNSRSAPSAWVGRASVHLLSPELANQCPSGENDQPPTECWLSTRRCGPPIPSLRTQNRLPPYPKTRCLPCRAQTRLPPPPVGA